MKAYYIQKAEQILPIFGVNSIGEAKDFVSESDQAYLIETSEDVYMNLVTGSVGFESDWDNLDEVVKVCYDAEAESWIEA